MPPKDATTSKTVPADCVSVLLMVINNTTISKAQYEMMSALDGTRTASSFEHQFRSITAKAKELKARQEQGEAFVPVTPAKKRGAGSVADDEGTPTKKRSPTKKSTGEPKPRTPRKPKAKKGSDSDEKFKFEETDSNDQNEHQEFVKPEPAWENADDSYFKNAMGDPM